MDFLAGGVLEAVSAVGVNWSSTSSTLEIRKSSMLFWEDIEAVDSSVIPRTSTKTEEGRLKVPDCVISIILTASSEMACLGGLISKESG